MSTSELETKLLEVVQAPTYRPIKPRAIAKQLDLDDDGVHELKRLVKKLVKRGQLAYGANHLVAPAPQSGGGYRVTGMRVDRLFARHDLENEEAQRYVEERLRRMGVIAALENAGFEPGDDVEIAGMLLELDPG